MLVCYFMILHDEAWQMHRPISGDSARAPPGGCAPPHTPTAASYFPHSQQLRSGHPCVSPSDHF